MGKGNLKKWLNLSAPEPLNNLKTFLLAFPISVFGSLGLGVLHLAVIHFTLTKGWQYAIAFSMGCALVEMLFVYMAGRAFYIMEQWKAAKSILHWISVLILVVLGCYCLFFSPSPQAGQQPDIVSRYTLSPFLLGMVARSMLPTMISYWLSWKTIIFGKGVRYKPFSFALGAGLGTLLMHGCYIMGGALIVDFLGRHLKSVYSAMGLILLISAVFQIRSYRKMRVDAA